MNIKDYQKLSTRTINTNLTHKENVSNMVFGILGEGGEVADQLKKNFFQNHQLDKNHLKEEIGDLMWYIVNLATLYDFSMDDILQENYEKLQKRYKKGFSSEVCINRE